MFSVGQDREQVAGGVGVDADGEEVVDLCRYRNRSTYADFGTMPTWVARLLGTACAGCDRWAARRGTGRHSHSPSRNARRVSEGL